MWRDASQYCARYTDCRDVPAQDVAWCSAGCNHQHQAARISCLALQTPYVSKRSVGCGVLRLHCGFNPQVVVHSNDDCHTVMVAGEGLLYMLVHRACWSYACASSLTTSIVVPFIVWCKDALCDSVSIVRIVLAHRVTWNAWWLLQESLHGMHVACRL
jgi:hypothetical protein